MRFESAAPRYAAHAGPQAAMVAALVRGLSPVAGPVALELGAGTGLLTRELVQVGYRVCATDLSPAMVAEGARRVPEAGWETRDAWAPGVGCCDALFSANLLQWAADPVAVFRAHCAALHPGGVMHQVMFTAPTLRELTAVAGEISPLVWRTPAAWVAAAKAAGLTVTGAEPVLHTARYADARAMLHAIHATGAVSEKSRLGAGELRRVLREYDMRFASPGGGVTATWAGLVIRAIA